MTERRDLAAAARGVIDVNKYMVLGTADAAGRPWVSPVYFTPDRYTDFYWVSSPDALHSRNIAAGPGVSIVVFDSQVPVGGAQAVYLTATAGPVPEDELGRCAGIFCSRLPEVRDYGPEQLRAPEPLRLYRARVTESSVLLRGGDPDNERGIDTRVAVSMPE